MAYYDPAFSTNADLEQAIALLRKTPKSLQPLPEALPETGLGETAALDLLAPYVMSNSALLDSPQALAHMDPPTPWITWVTAMWNARFNQNLLHPATAPFARDAEALVINWLAPLFGMDGGHMCSGSTIANLTALWVARDLRKVNRVVATDNAHISIKKAAHILGLSFDVIATDRYGHFAENDIGDLSNACLVLTAGTTSTGLIEPLTLNHNAGWLHVDAAWSGPMRLSSTYGHVLDGIESADSVSLSAHKWLYQPKDSALILFKGTDDANQAISFGGSYLAAPNVGVQGSRGAAAIPLLATLVAWGVDGVVKRIERNIRAAETLGEALKQRSDIECLGAPQSAINVFRANDMSSSALLRELPNGLFSTCTVEGETWLRSVAANPMADVESIIETLDQALATMNSRK